MAKNNIIHYYFPEFGLEISYNSNFVVKAQFIPKNSDKNYVFVSNDQTDLGLEVIEQLNCYLENPGHNFSLPLDYQGSEHQLKVWRLMLTIKAGETLSYGAAAKIIGSAAQAVGGACGKNPLPIFIPCHRIVGASNTVGGFNSGSILLGQNIKKWLLNHEGINL